MRLWAISDIHVSYPDNRAALADVPAHPDDWLILAGDVGDKPDHLEFALDSLAPKFRRVVWTPGNHDLWTLPKEDG
ncbi:metallophosphoesterase [Roseibium sp. RKSG952]|uniref:metallophosphoesterase family protein n=1 Tax=Roseibium sp. RKSG952 TaxID=2529384 RepID=UPI001FCC3F4A|nr:metallophosphoesterase [Roseibium sp. RKSG952]